MRLRPWGVRQAVLLLAAALVAVVVGSVLIAVVSREDPVVVRPPCRASVAAPNEAPFSLVIVSAPTQVSQGQPFRATVRIVPRDGATTKFDGGFPVVLYLVNSKGDVVGLPAAVGGVGFEHSIGPKGYVTQAVGSASKCVEDGTPIDSTGRAPSLPRGRYAVVAQASSGGVLFASEPRDIEVVD